MSSNRASDSSGDISDGIAGLVAVGSDNSAICTEYLAVDPGAVGAGEEGNGIGNIFRLSEPLERREFGELIDGVGLNKVPNVDFANMSWRSFGS